VTVRDLIKRLADMPADAEVLLRVFMNEEDGQRAEIDLVNVTPYGQLGRYVALEDGDQ
jgi:hypothetical protein